MNATASPIAPSIVAFWAALSIAASLLRRFVGFPNDMWLPLLFLASLIAPLATFLLAYLMSPGYRDRVQHVGLRSAIFVQTWRLGGVIFLVLHAFGHLSGMFALPAGLGDMAIGATAPAIAALVSSQSRFARGAFLAWNIFGILDMMAAVGLGFLASRSALAAHVTTFPMTTFPLMLIPTFLVPLFLIYHIVCLTHIKAVVS